MPVDYRDWSEGWIKEGYYISFIRDGIAYYEYVLARDFAHWDYPWHETVTTLSTSGPETPQNFEITKGYERKTGLNRIWQFIFGIKGQVYIYVELPGDVHRHGIPKQVKPSTTFRTVSHFEEYMSPYHQPHFITEHFLMRPMAHQITLEAYNPNAIDQPAVRLNFFISKMVTQRIGTVKNGVMEPEQTRFRELLEKLHKHQKPIRPITIEPVRAPAESPTGE